MVSVMEDDVTTGEPCTPVDFDSDLVLLSSSSDSSLIPKFTAKSNVLLFIHQ